MFHTALSQGKTYCTRKKKISLIESKWKGQEQGILLEPMCKGQRKIVLFKPKCKGQRKGILLEPKCKGQENIVDPGQRTGLLIIWMYTNKPRSKNRVYDLKNQSHETGNNRSI